MSTPLRFVVVDPSGATIRGAQVRLFQAESADGAPVQAGQTDASGRVALAVPAGKYLAVIAAEGFVSLSEPVTAGPIVTGKAADAVVRVKLRIQTRAESVDVVGDGGDAGSAAEGQTIVLRGAQLAALSSDPSVLQQQLNALVGTDDGSAPQLRIDGFSNGRLPPKSSIREVRINQNAFSAQFDERGGRVLDIFTRPGSQSLGGSVYLAGNADPFNARNPYLATKPAYHNFYGQGELNGPLGRNTSFFLSVSRNIVGNSQVVNATVLDGSLNPFTLQRTVNAPRTEQSYSVRLDHQLGSANTLTGRLEVLNNHAENPRVGQLVLPSQGSTADAWTGTLQVGDTTVVNAHTVLESRFQYQRTRTRQSPLSTATTLVVQGSFNGGGDPMQGARDALDNYEWQEYVSVDRGRHFLRGGVRYRLTRDSNSATANYNGQYVFPSIAAYQATLRGLQAGQTPAQIRAAGGGASQFSITTGSPAAVISTGDLGLYVEDEWKLRPSFALTTGLRFESQFGIPDHSDPTPRLGFAWTISRKGAKAPWGVLRGGVGLFYERFEAANLLTTARQNGVLQPVYFLQNPDTYPNVPSVSTLGAVTPTVYQLATGYRSPYTISKGLTLEKGFGRLGSLRIGLTEDNGVHLLLSRNANAPINGVRPLGGTQNVYQFASLGTSRTTTLQTYYTGQFGRRAGIWANYVLRFRETDAMGSTSFVSNSYDVKQDYARTQSVTRHRFYSGAWVTLPWKISASTFIAAHSSTRFNVTTGQDNNGDSIYNDRPAFATDLSRASVVRTAIGNFDTAPIAGQTIVPMNLGVAPGLFWWQLRAAREFAMGPKVKAPGAVATSQTGKVDRRIHSDLGFQVQNVLNSVNPATPVGQLSSPFFGRSLTLNSEQSGTESANRVVSVFLNMQF